MGTSDSGLETLIAGVLGRFASLPPDVRPPPEMLEENTRKELATLARKHRLPQGFAWARLGSPEFDAIRSKKARRFAAAWKAHSGSAILLGPTGVGKTAAMVALMNKILDAVESKPMPESKARWACGMLFTSAADLVVARRNAALGAESPAVEKAVDCSILFLDELGFEAKSTVPFEVVDHRYLAGRPTIITSGLTQPELLTKYGAAFVRRITDRGVGIIDLWEESGVQGPA